jgi:hypothetical protein
MEMMNRAIEDASDFKAMKEKLMASIPTREEFEAAKFAAAEGKQEHADRRIAELMGQKRPGENREEYRKRIYGADDCQSCGGSGSGGMGSGCTDCNGTGIDPRSRLGGAS